MVEHQDETCSCELHPAPQCWNTNNETRKYVDDAADLLNEQWPRGGSVIDYKCKLLGVDRNRLDVEGSMLLIETVDIDSSNKCSSHVNSLPCSYLLIETSGSVGGKLVGHGRLTECFDGPGGSAAAATFIITQPRRKGYGRTMMNLLEQEAVKLGYHYIYLWTTTAISFYCRLNYTKTERISLNSACLKTLEPQQVGTLEAMLARRSSTKAALVKKETVTLPPDADVTENDVWLRKRLVESVASITVPLQDRIKEIKGSLQKQNLFSHFNWEYHLQHTVPWQQQIGPSCGLAALRMLCDYYYHSNNNNSTDQNCYSMPSLLVEAQTKGYSTDGEIFDARNMVELAKICGLDATIQSFQSMTCAEILGVLLNGGTLIVPYDSQPCTKNPCTNDGKNAHYGIIVGMLFGYHNNKHHEADNNDLKTTNDDNSNDINNNNNNIDESSSLTLVELTSSEHVQDSIHTLLLVQHGSSSKLTIAPFDDFVASNIQLRTIDVTKCPDLPSNVVMNLSDCIIICTLPTSV